MSRKFGQLKRAVHRDTSSAYFIHPLKLIPCGGVGRHAKVSAVLNRHQFSTMSNSLILNLR
jgi:hypothetical protein